MKRLARIASVNGNVITLEWADDARHFKPGDKIGAAPDETSDGNVKHLRRGTTIVRSASPDIGVVYCESDVKCAIAAIADRDYLYIDRPVHTIKTWGPDGKQVDAPAAFVVMRTVRRTHGTQTSPVAVCATPESAAEMCSDFVVTWSSDPSVLHEDCPA